MKKQMMTMMTMLALLNTAQSRGDEGESYDEEYSTYNVSEEIEELPEGITESEEEEAQVPLSISVVSVPAANLDTQKTCTIQGPKVTSWSYLPYSTVDPGNMYESPSLNYDVYNALSNNPPAFSLALPWNQISDGLTNTVNIVYNASFKLLRLNENIAPPRYFSGAAVFGESTGNLPTTSSINPRESRGILRTLDRPTIQCTGGVVTNVTMPNLYHSGGFTRETKFENLPLRPEELPNPSVSTDENNYFNQNGISLRVGAPDYSKYVPVPIIGTPVNEYKLLNDNQGNPTCAEFTMENRSGFEWLTGELTSLNIGKNILTRASVRRINYRLCCASGALALISFSNSTFPSHQNFVDDESTGIGTQSNLPNFLLEGNADPASGYPTSIPINKDTIFPATSSCTDDILTIKSANGERGNITLLPDRKRCLGNTCSFNVELNTPVKIGIMAKDSYYISAVSGCDYLNHNYDDAYNYPYYDENGYSYPFQAYCDVTLGQAKTITVTYLPRTLTVNLIGVVNSNGTGKGFVVSNTNTIACGSDMLTPRCTGNFIRNRGAEYNNDITLTFIPAPGSVFKGMTPNQMTSFNPYEYTFTPAPSDTTVTINAYFEPIAPATVVNRSVFYNHSLKNVFGDLSLNPINAIDPLKLALLPGQTTSFNNYTNYTQGINGIVVDIAGISDPNLIYISQAGHLVNFIKLATWNGIDSGKFVNTGLKPSSVSVIKNGGVNGSDRFRIELVDNSIKNTWLRVTIPAGGPLNLAKEDVFYFGNAVGDMNIGNIGTPTVVRTDATDISQVRTHQSPDFNSVPITNIYDLNKDGRVNSTDTSAVRQNQNGALIKYFTAPPQGHFW